MRNLICSFLAAMLYFAPYDELSEKGFTLATSKKA